MTVKRNGALSFWKFIFCMIIVVHYAYFFKPAKLEKIGRASCRERV